MIVLASVLWGTMGILAKLSFVYGILPETLISLRLLISFATIFLSLLLVRRSALRVQKKDALFFLAFGVLAVAFQRISYFYAVELTTATIAAMLYYTYPLFVIILARILLKEKTTLGEIFGIILSFLGVMLVVRAYEVSALSANLAGIIFGLLSGLLFAVYFMLTKKLRKKYASWTITLYGEGIGALTLMPVAVVSVPEIAAFPLQLWLLIFTIALVPSLLAYTLYSHALKYVKTSKASVLAVIEPLAAAFFSIGLLAERLQTLQIVGIALALAGVVLIFWRQTE